MPLLSFTITADFAGAPVQIEIEVETDEDGTTYEVDKATLIAILPHVPRKHFFSVPEPPNFTPCRGLTIRLDPSETDVLFSTEIEAAIPVALREYEECQAEAEADAAREMAELDFMERRAS